MMYGSYPQASIANIGAPRAHVPRMRGDIGADGAAALTEGLQVNRTLTSLGLSDDNSIGGEGEGMAIFHNAVEYAASRM